MHRSIRLLRDAPFWAVLALALICAIPRAARADTITSSSGDMSDPIICAGAGPLAGLCESLVFTPPPNWALGSPQVAAVGACTFIVAGDCGGFEVTESIALQNTRVSFGPATTNALTFAQENAGIVIADIAIPNARWLRPFAFSWVGGPAGGGIFALLNTPGFANEYMAFDPAMIQPIDVLTGFYELDGGTTPIPTPTTITPNSVGTIPIPQQDQSFAPEPGYLTLISGAFAAMAGICIRRRRRQG